MSELKSTLCVLAAGVLWGTLPLFAKYFTGKGLSPEQIVFLRTGFAAVFLLLWLGVRKPFLLLFRPIDVWYFAALGIGSIMLFSYCYFRTIESGGIALAALLLYTSPAFVLLFSVPLFKERLTKRKLLAVALTIAGCACISGIFTSGAATVSWSVLLIGLGSGFFYSLYSIFGKYALRRYSSATVTTHALLFAAIGTGFLVPLPQTLALFTDIPMVLVASLMALCCSIGAFGFYALGLKGLPASKAGVLASIEPVTATLIGITVFHEAASLQTFLGMGLIIGAAILLNTVPASGTNRQ